MFCQELALGLVFPGERAFYTRHPRVDSFSTPTASAARTRPISYAAGEGTRLTSPVTNSAGFRRFLTAVDSNEAARRTAAAEVACEQLPQAILSKAFAGDLVPTEADLARDGGRYYEAAEQMLERVRREVQEPAATTTLQRKRAARV